MIPKIIHYCWFGKGLMPKSQEHCIETWKRIMPDYTIMRWDETTFDYQRYPASRFAHKVKKYALVSDVCRYNVLAEYGGIYLDTDVEVFQRFDKFLNTNFFSAIELYHEFETENIAAMLDEDGNPLVKGQEIPRLEMLTSTMGCEPNCEMICRLRDFYNAIDADEDYAIHYRDHVNNDRLVAKYAAEYGFRYKDETQHLRNDMVVYGTGIFGHAFCPNPQYSVSYHHNAASWEWEKKTRNQKMAVRFDKIGMLPLYNAYKKLKKRIKKRVLRPVIGEILCLHRVVPDRSSFLSNRELEITPDYLEYLIHSYRKKGFKFVKIDEIASSLKKRRLLFGKKQVNVSFDDGFQDVYTYAYPIFKKYNIPFTIYLTTDFPDKKADLWWLKLEQIVASAEEYETKLKQIFSSTDNMPVAFRQLVGVDINKCVDLIDEWALSWEQIQEMVNSGLCTIGSHTVSHPSLTRVSDEECRKELTLSADRVEEKTGQRPVHFSYPHSQCSKAVEDLIKESGYKTATLGYGGSIRLKDDVYCLNRNYIVQEDEK